MDTKKATKLKETARRTITIINLLLTGRSVQEIAIKAKADRQLVEYYKKILTIEK